LFSEEEVESSFGKEGTIDTARKLVLARCLMHPALLGFSERAGVAPAKNTTLFSGPSLAVFHFRFVNLQIMLAFPSQLLQLT
jgi:hypothetical protein